jgi:signal transduction histidine kinase
MSRLMSIRARFLLLVLLATFIPALAGVMLFLDYRESQIADARRNLAATTRQIELGITNTIWSTAQLEYGLSRARVFETNDRAACSAFLADVLKEFPQYTGILTLKTSGDLFCDSLRTGRVLNVRGRRYFQDALNAKSPLAVEPVFGRLTGIPVLQVAYGVRKKSGEPKFVLLASVNLEKFMQPRSLNLPQKDAVIAVTDSKGTILTWHPNGKKLSGTSIVDTPLFRFARERQGEDVQELVDDDGITRIWAVSTLSDFPETGLRILVGVSKDNLLAAVNRSLYQVLATLIVVWLAVFAGAWALMELGIRRQAARIVAAISKLSGGDSSARTGLLHSSDEFGQIARGFDNMASTLQTQKDEALRAAEEIRRLNADLECKVMERTAELAAANQELEAFSYSVSHDLRAPLRAIDGFSQAVIEDYADKLGDHGKNHLNRVRTATQHMGHLIDDLIKLARVARAEMKREAVDLSALAGAVLANLQASEPARKVEWRVEPGLVATGDANLLRVALDNLLGNAWKFTGKKARARIEFGVLQQASPGMDEVDRLGNKLPKTGEQVFFVRDNGVGFDMTYAGKLFSAFQRLHNVSEFPGTGIGLATVRRIVHRHGGRVWAEGVAGKGATFYFSL